MKKKFYILALDIGTSSLKAGLFDQDYDLVATDKVDYTYETWGMHVQMDPEKIWKAFLNVAEKFRDSLDRVELLVQCVLSPSLIPMDESADLPKDLGTRHLAALSVTRDSDAIVIVEINQFAQFQMTRERSCFG